MISTADKLPENIGIMLGILISGLVIYQVLFFFFKRWALKKKRMIPGLLQTYIYYPGLIVMLIITLYAGMPLLREYLYLSLYTTLRHILLILIIGSSGILVIQVITVLREIMLHHYQKENPRDYTLRKAKTKFQL